MGKKSVWTSPFAKILSKTEDEKSLSPINKLMRSFKIKNDHKNITNVSTPKKRQFSLRTKQENTIDALDHPQIHPDYDDDCSYNIYETINLEEKFIQRTTKKQENVKPSLYENLPITAAPIKIHSYQTLASAVAEAAVSPLGKSVLRKTHPKRCLFDKPSTCTNEDEDIEEIGNIKEKIAIFEKATTTKSAKLSRNLFYDKNGIAINPNSSCNSKHVRNKDRLQEKLILNCDDNNIVIQSQVKSNNRVVTPTVMKVFSRLEKCNNYKSVLTELQQSIMDMQNHYSEPIYNSPIKHKKKSSFRTTEFQRLTQDLHLQCNYMNQASKALEFYEKLNKPLEQTYVQAERILLLATCRYEAILSEIRSESYKTPKNSIHIGTVKINNITLMTEQQVGGEWYVCVISHLDQVYATSAIQAISNQSFMTFRDRMTFVDINLDSKIIVRLFVIKPKQRNNKKTNLRKSSRKIAYKDLQCDLLVENFVNLPAFDLCGKLNVAVEELEHRKAFLCVTPFPEKPTQKHIKIEANIYYPNSVGFINTGIEADQEITWRRKWCRLNGKILQFWNEPNDAGVENPEQILELARCTDAIKETSTSSESTTLTVVTLDNFNKEKRTYLNFDSRSRMRAWKQNLNEVYQTLFDWKSSNALITAL